MLPTWRPMRDVRRSVKAVRMATLQQVESRSGNWKQRMRRRPWSEQRGYPYKRGHFVRLRGSLVKKNEAMCSGLPSLGEIIT